MIGWTCEDEKYRGSYPPEIVQKKTHRESPHILQKHTQTKSGSQIRWTVAVDANEDFALRAVGPVLILRGRWTFFFSEIETTPRRP